MEKLSRKEEDTIILLSLVMTFAFFAAIGGFVGGALDDAEGFDEGTQTGSALGLIFALIGYGGNRLVLGPDWIRRSLYPNPKNP